MECGISGTDANKNKMAIVMFMGCAAILVERLVAPWQTGNNFSQIL